MYYPQYDKASYLAFQAVFYGAVWYVLLILCVQNVNALLNAICLIALANVGLMILQYFGIDPIFKPIAGYEGYYPGFMPNNNLTSGLLAICLPAFLRYRWALLLPMVFLGLILAKTTGGALAAVAGLIVWLNIKFPRTYLTIIVLIGLVLFLVFVDNPGIAARLEVWMIGLKESINHPLLGAGIGHWKTVFNMPLAINNLRWTTPHNEFIQAYFEMGVFAVVIIMGYLVSVTRRFRNINTMFIAAFAVIVVNSLVNFPFHIATTAYIAVTWIALMDKEIYGWRNQRNTQR
jgi:O-antigen ligase